MLCLARKHSLPKPRLQAIGGALTLCLLVACPATGAGSGGTSGTGSSTTGVGLGTTLGSSTGQATDAADALGPGFINVRNAPYGAAGDGQTDDTAAVQNALNGVADAGGGEVWLPTGNYLIASHLTVPAHTSLVGVFRAPTASAQHKGTTLLAVEGAGNAAGTPFITLTGPNSVLDGVTVFYPNQTLTNPPVSYPWTVRAGGGENVTVQNVLLLNPFDGIDLATNTSARHLVRGVYGEPLHQGISVDQCYDIGRIMDVHFWPFWSISGPAGLDPNIAAYKIANAFAFVFARSDWEVVQDVFGFGYHVGMELTSSTSGAMNGQMSNIDFDGADVGIDVYATQAPGIHISNLNLANDALGGSQIALLAHPGAEADLDVRGASFWGGWHQAVSWDNPGMLQLSDARVLNWAANVPSTTPAVAIVSGRAMLHDNLFQDGAGVAIDVGAGANRVMITGNQLAGNTVVDNGPTTLSANNQP